MLFLLPRYNPRQLHLLIIKKGGIPMKFFHAVLLSAILGSNAVAADLPNMKIGNGIQVKRAYYLLLKKSGGNWEVQNVSLSPLSISDRTNEEILVFNSELSAVEPDYSEYAKWIRGNADYGTSSQADIPKGIYHCQSADSKARPNYNPCDSEFAQIPNRAAMAAANVIGNVFTFGMGAVLGGAYYHVSVNEEKITQVLTSPG